MTEPKLGAKYHGYDILDILGEGGQGAVYLAADSQGNRVALKYVRGERELVKRGIQEARLLKTVDCKQVVKVIDHQASQDYDDMFVVLEFVKGITLRKAIGQTPMVMKEALPLFYQLLRAVGEIHAAKIAHRDLKPDNILVTATDHDVKIIDFGAAKSGDEDVNIVKTQAAQRLGTLKYMAPESLSGKKPEDWRPVDIYACGCILYEMLVGRPPYVLTDATKDIYLWYLERHRHGKPEWPSGQPAWIRDYVSELMAPIPGNRPDIASAQKRIVARCSEFRLPTVNHEALTVALFEELSNRSRSHDGGEWDELVSADRRRANAPLGNLAEPQKLGTGLVPAGQEGSGRTVLLETALPPSTDALIQPPTPPIEKESSTSLNPSHAATGTFPMEPTIGSPSLSVRRFALRTFLLVFAAAGFVLLGYFLSELGDKAQTPTAPMEYIRVAVIKDGEFSGRLGAPYRKRVSAMAATDLPVGISNGQLAQLSRLTYPADKDWLYVFHCKPGTHGILDPIPATWQEVFRTASVDLPPTTCPEDPLCKIREAWREMSTIPATAHPTERLASVYKAAWSALSDSAVAEVLRSTYGADKRFDGSGYLGSADLSRPSERIVREYLLDNVVLRPADGVCRCLRFDLRVERSMELPFDADVLWSKGIPIAGGLNEPVECPNGLD